MAAATWTINSGNGTITFTPVEQSGALYDWFVGGTPLQTTATPDPFTTGLPTPNTNVLIQYQITMPDGTQDICFFSISCDTFTCHSTVTPRIGCSEFFFDLDIDQNAFPTGTVHSFDFDGAHSDSGNPLSIGGLQNSNFPYEQRIQNIRTSDALITITHSWTLAGYTIFGEGQILQSDVVIILK